MGDYKGKKRETERERENKGDLKENLIINT
jgi:hypothetical protein